jgi:transposase
MARYRRFSFEFKRQVVLDFLEGRAELRGLARQHSLSRHLIRLWIQKYEAGQLNDEVVDAVRIAEYETKIAELERKVGQLTMEVDLLKKGARWVRRHNGEIISSTSIASGPKVSPSREDVER